jgi:hypothetical protein
MACSAQAATPTPVVPRLSPGEVTAFLEQRLACTDRVRKFTIGEAESQRWERATKSWLVTYSKSNASYRLYETTLAIEQLTGGPSAEIACGPARQ